MAISSRWAAISASTAVNRAVAVNVGALREGLAKVYHARNRLWPSLRKKPGKSDEFSPAAFLSVAGEFLNEKWRGRRLCLR